MKRTAQVLSLLALTLSTGAFASSRTDGDVGQASHYATSELGQPEGIRPFIASEVRVEEELGRDFHQSLLARCQTVVSAGNTFELERNVRGVGDLVEGLEFPEYELLEQIVNERIELLFDYEELYAAGINEADLGVLDWINELMFLIMSQAYTGFEDFDYLGNVIERGENFRVYQHQLKYSGKLLERTVTYNPDTGFFTVTLEDTDGNVTYVGHVEKSLWERIVDYFDPDSDGDGVRDSKDSAPNDSSKSIMAHTEGPMYGMNSVGFDADFLGLV